jgi:hypothetical protein
LQGDSLHDATYDGYVAAATPDRIPEEPKKELEGVTHVMVTAVSFPGTPEESVQRGLVTEVLASAISITAGPSLMLQW